MTAPIYSHEGLVDAVTTARELIALLKESQTSLGETLPLNANTFALIDGHQRMQVDAFLKRFEQAQDIIGRTVFRAAALALGEDLVGRSLYDSWMALEGAGGIESTKRWQELTATRNALVHEYPMSAAQKIERINRAWTDSADVIFFFENLVQFLEQKGILP